jgi:hypothetical protein
MTKPSLFKFLWVGNLAGFFFLFLLCGLAALGGAEVVFLNREPVTGPGGLLLSMAMWPIFAAIFTCIQWVFFAFGFWVYSRFGRLILEVRDGRLETATATSEPRGPS